MQPAASGASEGFIGLFPCQCRRPRSRAALPRATAGCSSPGRFATCRRRNEFGGIPKRNFEIFKAPDFIAAALLHLPPNGQQTVRYYGVYSNKVRGRVADKSPSLIIESAVSNPISIGSIVQVIHRIPTPMASTNAKHGSLPKSIWKMAESWFSIRTHKSRTGRSELDPAAKRKPQQGGEVVPLSLQSVTK